MRTLWWTIVTVICSPLLLLHAFLRRRKEVQKVLVIQLGALGDLLCTTPFFRAIKTTYPHAQVHVLCFQKSSIVLKNNPSVDQVHFYDKTPRHELIHMLRQERFDWSINCLPGAFASVVGLWSLVPHRINTPSTKHGVLVRILGFFSQYGDSYPLGTHTYDHYMRLASTMGAKSVPYTIDFYPGNEHMNLPIRDGFIILSLTAGNHVKEWPLSNFAKLADYVTEEIDRDVLLSTLDVEAVQTVRSTVHNPARLHDGSSMSLAEIGDACRRAGAFVSVDTGPLYIAYAMECPTVVMIGPVHPKEQVPPESERVAHVPPPAGCQPWVHISLTPREGTEEQLKCVRETTVGEVVKGLERVIKNR